MAEKLLSGKVSKRNAVTLESFPSGTTLEPELLAAFPPQMQARHRDAILHHRLRREIIATKVANRFVNRLGIIAPFALVEEEGAAFGQAAAAFIAAERLFGMNQLWADLKRRRPAEDVRLALFNQAAGGLQFHIADLLRSTSPDLTLVEIVARIQPGLDKLNAALSKLLRPEPRTEAASLRGQLQDMGGSLDLVERIVRLFELNGGIGLAALGQRIGVDEVELTRAYTRLGEALGLDWAQHAATQFHARDQWERLLTAGLARDFEQLRIEFLGRRKGDPEASVDKWVAEQGARIAQFRHTVERARTASVTTAAMLAQIAAQARVLLAR